MNITEFRNYLEERIRVLGTELEELMCARKALDRAEAQHRPAPRLEAPRRLKRAAPMLDKDEARRVRQAILDHLANVTAPQSTAQMVHAAVGMQPDKRSRDRAYNQMTVLVAKGLIAKRGVGMDAVYLPQPAPLASDEAA